MIKVNLLSPGKKEVAPGKPSAAFVEEEKEPKVNMGAILAAVLITVGIIGYLYLSQSSELHRKQSLLSEKQARKAELDKVLKTVAKLESTKLKLDKKVKIIQELKNKQKAAVRMMDEISQSLPDNVWLTRLTFNRELVNLEGQASTNDLVADFIHNMKASNFFYGEKFNGSTRRVIVGTEIFSFKLSIRFSENLIKQEVL
ncbi:MAG: PilN domain-containing protein [Candidatus Aminicenantes bacterium]|nr:PilN domain-containing protein [Candidatus Aminicenantes bacterium]